MEEEPVSLRQEDAERGSGERTRVAPFQKGNCGGGRLALVDATDVPVGAGLR